ncbi:MAG: two-component system sensor histidine kinase CreC [Candidatus Hydrogenedentes bacterium]|nr:two-component system sensor histidine kinase CreC [Candidatus Hydrogenedentota bacterium]
MSIRARIALAFLLLAGAGIYWLVDWVIADLRPRYLAAMEESMVDTATVLSTWAANEAAAGVIDTSTLGLALNRAQKRTLSARIYEVTKTKMDLRVYVTDRTGKVLYDSSGGRDEGKDYALWNDVYKTLRGQYGARATLEVPDDPLSEVLYVASPVIVNGQIAGVLSVGKPARSVAHFLETARTKIMFAGVMAAFMVVLFGLLVSSWITWPIEQLIRHARAIRDGRRSVLPILGKNEIGALGQAFEEMRSELEGKKYVEEYVQTLTHQMKSPLSAIQGAAELLDEEMSPEQRAKFLTNLRNESQRLHDVIERILELAALENRMGLRDVEAVDLATLTREAAQDLAAAGALRQVRFEVTAESSITVLGEHFLLYQALANLLQNALDFSSDNAIIQVDVSAEKTGACVRIGNTGPQIPDYALPRVFERFYSLQRPGTGRKSSGLGLPFAREVATLHGGRVHLENTADGVCAVLQLPLPAPESV